MPSRRQTDKIVRSDLSGEGSRERSMRLPRFTVRWLMIAVAIVGLALARVVEIGAVLGVVQAVSKEDGVVSSNDTS